MALFGIIDRDVPLIVRFYQAEELRELYAYVEYPSSLEASTLVHLHELTRSILDVYTDGVEHPLSLLLDLCDWWGQLAGLGLRYHYTNDRGKPDAWLTPMTPAQYRGKINGDDLLTPPLPEGDALPVRPGDYTLEPGGGSPLERAVLAELIDVVNRKVALSRCEECKNPMIIKRSGQKYCSHRCANRVSTRRSRAKPE